MDEEPHTARFLEEDYHAYKILNDTKDAVNSPQREQSKEITAQKPRKHHVWTLKDDQAINILNNYNNANDELVTTRKIVVYKPERSLYGLAQSPALWYDIIARIFEGIQQDFKY